MRPVPTASVPCKLLLLPPRQPVPLPGLLLLNSTLLIPHRQRQTVPPPRTSLPGVFLFLFRALGQNVSRKKGPVDTNSSYKEKGGKLFEKREEAASGRRTLPRRGEDNLLCMRHTSFANF
jgi:hypothetical protein